MSLLTRIANVFRGDRLSGEIDEELATHIAEAVREGRDPGEAKRALGNALQHREQSREWRVLAWLDSLRADTIFGWRQITKRKAVSLAAALSLGLAIGSCTSAFRLIDAILLRPLPVAHADRLYVLSRVGTDLAGKPAEYDGWPHAAFQLMRPAVSGQAELIAASYAETLDVTYGSDMETEKAHVQFVSGWMFDDFGLRPAAGRLLHASDDVTRGAHPYAVLSYDYWSRRFARDAGVVGRSVRIGDRLYQVVGVGPEKFTGTETGIVIDIFLPAMMHPGALRDDWTWIRTLAIVAPGTPVEPIRARLNSVSRAFEIDRMKQIKGITQSMVEQYLAQKVVMEPAASGASGLRQDYRVSLLVIGVLVAMVLLIACANVANLMTAQATSRTREMAMRVSIGAGRARLVQLVMVESAWLALLAAAIGALFTWWAAPFVVSRINPPDNPVRLFLPADWRVMGFGLALTTVVALLFGLAPALRASTVKPAVALKGGSDPHARRRLMHTLIAVQAAFCFLVLFLAGLFTSTFERLSHSPTGFSADRVLALDLTAHRAESPVVWDELADQVRAVPGVESVAQASWPLLTQQAWNGFISVDGNPPGPDLAYFVNISPGWMATMKLPFVDGRDLRPDETFPGAALVNETFVRQFAGGASPFGRTFAKATQQFRVVGIVRDAPYKNLHEPILPVVYVPTRFLQAGTVQPIRKETLLVRTVNPNPLTMTETLRRELARVRSDFRISTVRSQAALVQVQSVRERLLAMLSLFFAGVSLLLAGIGLYGVLDYSVMQRRKEIGIRMALGARAGNIARALAADALLVIAVGGIGGVAAGLASVRYIASLLYQVKATDASMLVIPSCLIVSAAFVAALPAMLRAVRIDPVSTLRSE